MQIMGRSRFISLLLVFVSLVLLLSPGSSRKIMEIVQQEDFAARAMQESAEKFREMIEVMDYSDPEPNTNVKGGIISPPPEAFIERDTPKV